MFGSAQSVISNLMVSEFCHFSCHDDFEKSKTNNSVKEEDSVLLEAMSRTDLNVKNEASFFVSFFKIKLWLRICCFNFFLFNFRRETRH